MKSERFPFEKRFYPEQNLIEIEGALVSLHCHHFNCGLLKGLEELQGIDGLELFVKTTEEVYNHFFRSYLARHPEIKTPEEKLAAAAAMYHFFGYGHLDLSQLSEKGGEVKAYSSYYVTAWLAKYGRRKQKVCYFTCGFLAGIMTAIFERPLGSYLVKEKKCLILGDQFCLFQVEEAFPCP